ncbi:spore coat protein U domain-containing protein [Variovorax sp. PCZ-1]|uniref:spore coat protein U domain-containing protein n=1 Tax=Variovorax sp. PCZ-1 TaxID=2835533 RepID=UPI001BCF8068|nr:spore coat protein U domain-containing protein [Variovorax sp. PCZ-1]MBS7808035.1 spore coat protein U domain-containing protein [Variovorax sp. PCZ-1]
MKKIALVAAMTAALVSSFSAHAVTATDIFNVNITLTANCSFQTTAADIDLAYTSFQAANVTGNTSFAVRCTNNLPYALSLDRASTDTGTGTTYSYTDVTTNLNYTLALSAASGTGNGGNQSYTVNATIAGSQSGNCATPGTLAAAGTCNNSAGTDKARTVTITY